MPDDANVAPAVFIVPGTSQAMAQNRMALIDSLAVPEDSFTLLSEVLNFGFGTKAHKEPFSYAQMPSISGLQAIRD